MDESTFIPKFDQLVDRIAREVASLREPQKQWADIARLAIQGLPHDSQSLAALENYINQARSRIRKDILIASEHFTEEQLELLRKRAVMSKYAWRNYKRSERITTKNGFRLLIY